MGTQKALYIAGLVLIAVVLRDLFRFLDLIMYFFLESLLIGELISVWTFFDDPVSGGSSRLHWPGRWWKLLGLFGRIRTSIFSDFRNSKTLRNAIRGRSNWKESKDGLLYG